MDGANGGLTLPQQVRAEWLADPVRAREWKSFLTRFDERYCQVSGAKIEGGTVTAVTTGAGAAADHSAEKTLRNVMLTLGKGNGTGECPQSSVPTNERRKMGGARAGLLLPPPPKLVPGFHSPKPLCPGRHRGEMLSPTQSRLHTACVTGLTTAT